MTEFVMPGRKSTGRPNAAVKICGLKNAAHVQAAADAGARYVGFVFFPKSPRHVTPDEVTDLAEYVPVGVAKVALTVNADDSLLDEITTKAPFDMLQLHGAESPERVVYVKARYGLPVMKAIGIATEEDVAQIDLYAPVADQLLIDAKAPCGADLPGGNGGSFEWRLVQRKYWPCSWMLAGGLTPDNVAEAIRLTGAKQVDVSSGVENAPGEKNAQLIADFVTAARGRPA